MTDLERAQMELAAANLQLQLHEGRAIVKALLKESDWALIVEAEEAARTWLRDSKPLRDGVAQ